MPLILISVSRSAYRQRRKKITTTEQWWNIRRPEIAIDFKNEIYGNPLANIRDVTSLWVLNIEVNSKFKLHKYFDIHTMLVQKQ
jgi:hypothetical protein